MRKPLDTLGIHGEERRDRTKKSNLCDAKDSGVDARHPPRPKMLPSPWRLLQPQQQPLEAHFCEATKSSIADCVSIIRWRVSEFRTIQKITHITRGMWNLQKPKANQLVHNRSQCTSTADILTMGTGPSRQVHQPRIFKFNTNNRKVYLPLEKPSWCNPRMLKMHTPSVVLSSRKDRPSAERISRRLFARWPG